MKWARQKGSSREAYGSETIRARKLMEHETGTRKTVENGHEKDGGNVE